MTSCKYSSFSWDESWVCRILGATFSGSKCNVLKVSTLIPQKFSVSSSCALATRSNRPSNCDNRESWTAEGNEGQVLCSVNKTSAVGCVSGLVGESRGIKARELDYLSKLRSLFREATATQVLKPARQNALFAERLSWWIAEQARAATNARQST